MPLSKTERLILANQYRILEHLAPKDREYATAREALENGYERYYDRLVGAMEDPFPASSGDFVLEVLAMYGVLQDAQRALGDQAEVRADDVAFPGFDGNNETEHMAYARFLVEREDLFSFVRRAGSGDGFNSHMQTIPRYRAMLAAWRSFGKDGNLTVEQLRAIISAR